MESFRNHHAYESLDRGKNEIRIFQLMPGKIEDPVRGTLRSISLDDQKDFDALSYRWGDPTATAKIQVDGNDHFLVTQNAFSALQGLRQETTTVWLWIDAICIDQSSIDERNHQVSVMCQIYEKAVMVHVWLDIEVPHKEPAYQKLKDIHEESTTDDIGDDASFWEPLTALAESEYWWRIWIQQEVAFARHILIHCVDYTVSGASLHAFKVLTERMANNVHASGPLPGTSPFNEWMRVSLGAIDISGRNRPGIGAFNTAWEGNGAKRFPNLVRALTNGAVLSATDPRDKVFATLSLVNGELASKFGIDYRQSVAEVYSRAIRLIVEQYKSLGFLTETYEVNRHHEVPSWVPDWSSFSKDLGPKGPADVVLRCTGGRGPQHEPQVSDDGLRLTVCGAKVEVLRAVSEEQLSPWDGDIMLSIVKMLHQLKHQDVKCARGADCLADKLDLGDIPDEQWKALFRTTRRADNPNGRRAVESYLEPYKIVMLAIMACYPDPPTLPEGTHTAVEAVGGAHIQAMRYVTSGEYFSFMCSGKLGLIPKGAAAGDEIWALLHCPRPIVLRPLDHGYKVIGPCHIDDEHVIKDLEGGLENEQRYPLEDIVLV